MKHILIIGSGIAGQTAALEADGYDDVRVTLITKGRLHHGNTRYAQGGVAVVVDAQDSVADHVRDTLIAGAGISHPHAVQVLCEDGPDAVEALMKRGVAFDTHNGSLALGLEAAHSHQRIVHAGGDATGAVIATSLSHQLRASNVTVAEHTMATDLIVDNGQVIGVELLDGEPIHADAMIIATGGAGQLFSHTTNPDIATGDGIAMALRAGALLADLEFYQFHPTALATPGSYLVSEAVRGEGAVLIDQDGQRFMLEVHRDAELAPRDIVARGIAAQMTAQGGEPVHLDARGLGQEFLARRFPTIDAAVREHGFDWARVPIPVAPAAHYFMGGVRTDTWGRTSIAGLYAIGEAACNGLHGANRLASNSLLEGAVYGRRVVKAVLEDGVVDTIDDSWQAPQLVDLASGSETVNLSDLQQLMSDDVSLLRDDHRLRHAARVLAQWAAPEVIDSKSAETRNLLHLARAMVTSALARKESRGGHYRTDHPQTEPRKARHSTVLAAR